MDSVNPHCVAIPRIASNSVKATVVVVFAAITLKYTKMTAAISATEATRRIVRTSGVVNVES